MRLKLTTVLVIALFLAIGCAGSGKREVHDLTVEDREAWAFLAELDHLVDHHGVRDGRRFPVPGFPYLRTDRFLEAMQSRLGTPERQHHWIEQIQAADLESRRREIDICPKKHLLSLQQVWMAH